MEQRQFLQRMVLVTLSLYIKKNAKKFKFITLRKSQDEVDGRPQNKPDTLKLIEGNMETSPEGASTGDNLLSRIPTAQALSKTNN